MEVTYDPLTLSNLPTYLKVGLQAYNDHYLHLWNQGDAAAFIEENLTEAPVLNALKDARQSLFIIRADGQAVGILKLTLDAGKRFALPKSNVLLNKIYLVKAFAGRGIGSDALAFVIQFAQKHKRTYLWLLCMQKGPALGFYQKHGFEILAESEVRLHGILEAEKAMWVMGKPL